VEELPETKLTFAQADEEEGLIFGVEKSEELKLSYMAYVKAKNETTGEVAYIAATKTFLTDVPFLEVITSLVTFLKDQHDKI
jgi:hypothetical protein